MDNILQMVKKVKVKPITNRVNTYYINMQYLLKYKGN